MKKILTIALVAVLATASVFAGVNFSGRFRQGYVFTFADGEDVSAETWKTEEAKLTMKFSDDNGVWTVNLKNYGALDSNDKWAANATVDVKKALAAAGVDTGDFGLKVSFGNNEKMTALSAYDDAVTGNEYYKLKNNGKESLQLAASYKMVKVNVVVDPTNKNWDKDAKEYVAGGNPSALVSAQLDPVAGVSVAGAYAYKGYFSDKTFGKALKDYTADNMVGGSVKVDVKKLADLDFALSFSAYDNFAFGDTKVNDLAANVYGGYGKFEGGVEFVMGSVMDSETTTKCGLNAIVNFNATDDLAFDAYANIGDLSAVGDSLVVGADAGYTLAGVGLNLNLEYDFGGKSFSVLPYAVIKF